MATEQFHYTLEDGRQVALPHFRHIPFGVIRKLRNEDESEQLFGLVEQVADDETLAVIDTLGMGEIEALFQAWQDASKVTVGESLAS